MQVFSENGDESKYRQQARASSVLLLGAVLGFFAERLMWEAGPTGLGFALWVGLFGVAASRIAWLRHPSELLAVLTWSAVAFAAAVTMTLRTSAPVILAMLFVLVVSAAMLLLRASGRSLQDSTLADYLLSMLQVPVQAGVAAIGILRTIDLRPAQLDPRIWSALRGVLFALPVLLLFGLLFASADAAFNKYANKLITLLSEEALGHMAMVLAFSWLSTGLLAGLLGREGQGSEAAGSRRRRWLEDIGDIEVAVALVLLLALFAVFVALQLGYLFGGRETIERISGLTLANYARRGFFESLFITGLTLSLLILVASSNCSKRVFRPLGTLLILCVFVVLFSAAQRLDIYVDEFGLTLARFTAAAIMLWLGIGLLIFSGTLLLGKTRYFAAGLCFSAVVLAGLFSLINPSRIIVEENLNRQVTVGNPGRYALDSGYLLSLGADAVPVLAGRLSELPAGDRCFVAQGLLLQWSPLDDETKLPASNWRGWNASRTKAREVVLQHRAILSAVAVSCAGAYGPRPGFRTL